MPELQEGSNKTMIMVRATIGKLIENGAARLFTGPFGSSLHAHDYLPVGTPVVPTEAIGNRLLLEDKLPHIGPAKTAELSKYKLKSGDIVFARRGAQATGKSAMVLPHQAGWIAGTGAIVLRLEGDSVDPIFLSFVLSSAPSVEWLKSHAVGAVMPNLNSDVIAGLPVHLPPLKEQRRIANVLADYDDKIELNRRMNETLEAMARAIFKSLFVDFDPVRAKSEGRKPAGMDEATAALFPDAFQPSPLGPIPKGWEVSRIGDEVTVVGGSTPRTEEPAFWGGTHAFATPKDLSGLNSPVLLQTERQITEAGVQEISSGVLAKGTVLFSSRAPIGYLAIAELPVSVNQGFIAMVCNKRLPNHYVLHWTQENMPTIEANANGTTFLEVSKASFRPIQVIVPEPKILERFTAIVHPLYELVVSNLRESQTLATTRDTLLPKLLSGEISVSGTA